MKKHIRIISILVILVMVFGSIPAFAVSNHDQDLNKARANMLRMGFRNELINDLPDSEILKYKDSISTEITEKYYRISCKLENGQPVDPKMEEIPKEQCLDEVKKHDDTESLVTASLLPNGDNTGTTYSWIRIYMYVTYNGNGNYYYSSDFQWLANPDRLIDVFSLSIDSGCLIQSSTSYFYYKCDAHHSLDGENYTLTPVTLNNPDYSSGGTGIAFSFDMIQDGFSISKISGEVENVYYSNFRGYMTTSVLVKVPTTNQYLALQFEYAHKYRGLKVDPSYVVFPVPGASLVISPSEEYTEAKLYRTFWHQY